MPATRDEAQRAKQKLQAMLSEIPEFETAPPQVGIALFEAGFGIKINVPEASAAVSRLPLEVDGVPVKVEVVGTPRKLI